MDSEEKIVRKRQRISTLTDIQYQVIDLKIKNPEMSHAAIGLEVGIHARSVTRILRMRNKWRQYYQRKKLLGESV